MNVLPVLERPPEPKARLSHNTKKGSIHISELPQLARQSQQHTKISAPKGLMTTRDLVRISLEKFKLNKTRRESTENRTAYETNELCLRPLLTDRAQKSNLRSVSPLKSNPIRNTKNHILQSIAQSNFSNQPMNQIKLSYINDKIKLHAEDALRLKQSRVAKDGNEFLQSQFLSPRLLTSQMPRPLSIHKKVKSISGTNVLRKKIPSIPKLEIGTLQNFNDYYYIPVTNLKTEDNTNRAISQQPSLEGKLDLISRADEVPNYLHQLPFYPQRLKNPKGDLLNFTERESTIRSPSSSYLRHVTLLDFKKPCLAISKTTNRNDDIALRNSKRMSKISPKKGFVDYIKNNLDFNLYFKILEREPKPTDFDLAGNENSISFINNTQSENPWISELQLQGEIKPRKPLKKSTVFVSQDPVFLKSSYAYISDTRFIPSSCPLNIQHQYPVPIKTPYVYEYFSHLQYNSYWLDRITQLSEGVLPLGDAEVGYYNLREVSQIDIEGMPQEFNQLFCFVEKVAQDIKHEHESIAKLNNSFLQKSPLI